MFPVVSQMDVLFSFERPFDYAPNQAQPYKNPD